MPGSARIIRSLLVCSAVVLTRATISVAEEPTKPTEAQAASTPASVPASLPASPVRRDPKGVQGVSPLTEALARGDGAVLARDYDTALAAYRDLIAKNPRNAGLYCRLAEAHKLKGANREADLAYDDALRFVGNDPSLKAKILFGKADLSERQKDYENALERWNRYQDFVKTAPKAKTFPASAAERKKRISEWKQISAGAAEVKARIEKRLKEAEEATRKNATGK